MDGNRVGGEIPPERQESVETRSIEQTLEF